MRYSIRRQGLLNMQYLVIAPFHRIASRRNIYYCGAGAWSRLVVVVFENCIINRVPRSQTADSKQYKSRDRCAVVTHIIIEVTFQSGCRFTSFGRTIRFYWHYLSQCAFSGPRETGAEALRRAGTDYNSSPVSHGRERKTGRSLFTAESKTWFIYHACCIHFSHPLTANYCCRAQRGSTLFLPQTGFRRRDVHSRDGSWPIKRRPGHMRVVAHIVVWEEIPDVRGNLHSSDSFGMCYLCVNPEFLSRSWRFEVSYVSVDIFSRFPEHLA